jgi:putative transposase
MAVSKMELLELVSKAEAGDVDFLREGVRVLAQALMEAEVSAQIGAEHGQRVPDRVTHRNGYRARDWDTRAGTIELAIPRLRQGSYLPSMLEPRRRAEKALTAVIAQCYVEGVSTRRVDDVAVRWVWTGSASRRSAGSAPSSTNWSRRGGTGRWMPARMGLCGWTR